MGNWSHTWLQGFEDMQWLNQVYGAPGNLKSAILTGNEDAAIEIDGWIEDNPHYQTPPDWHYDQPINPIGNNTLGS